ncbi:MAG: glycine cleavage system protein R, partial [Verrucomicrobiales bacterium]
MQLVLTLLGPDKPGLVDSLAATINEHGGNWLDSRMAHLSGHFAGLLKIECPDAQAASLRSALLGLNSAELTLQIAEQASDQASSTSSRQFQIDIIGHDQPGIVRRLSSTLAAAGANVEQLDTRLEAAPMAGHPLFHALGTI